MTSEAIHQVTITGMGAVSAAGDGKEALLEALQTGKSLVGRAEEPMEDGPCLEARPQNWSFTDALTRLAPPTAVQKKARRAGARAPLALQMSAAAALQAWMDAGLDQHHVPARTAVVVAGHNLSVAYSAQMADKFRANPHYLVPSYGLNYLDTQHMALISDILDIQGEGYTVGGASGSGGVALLNGYRLVKHGYVDRCLVVGAPALLSQMELFSFYQMGALGGRRFADQPERACRPFDEDREGFIPGVAGACLVLEAVQLAQARGAREYARLAGAAMKLDGNRTTEPNRDGETAVMRQVMAQAQVGPEAVSYINAHGTASNLGDVVEAAAINAVFGPHRPLVNSTKALLGHCLFSAGVLEAAATLLQMRHGFAHANPNLERPLPEAPNLVGREKVSGVFPIALSNSFGFGGINTSALFQIPPER